MKGIWDMVHSSYRVMPICIAMGQAVGTAAALCGQLQVKPSELPTTELQDKLQRQGIPDPKDIPIIM